MYQKSVKEVLKLQNTSLDGLRMEEAKKRLLEGKNELKQKKRTNCFFVFFQQLNDLLVIILIVSAAISYFIKDYESSIVILTVIFLNALIGTIEYYKGKKSLNSLKAMFKKRTLVIRDKQRIEVPTETVVRGDILVLEAGNIVSADARVVEANNLATKESTLTGETSSISKTTKEINETKGISDQNNMVFSSSLIVSGSGLAIVVKTGMDTEIGRIADLLNKTRQEKTPLQVKLSRFSQILACGILLISIALFLINLARGASTFDSMMFAVALAVAAIPEALGSIVTITLAIATEKMAKRNTIVKDLKALETIGSVSVICTDKTGTITQNKMSVESIFSHDVSYEKDQAKDEIIFKCGFFCNNAYFVDKRINGNQTDVAILEICDKVYQGNRTFKRIKENPFDSKKRMMSVIVDEGKKILYAKGALEIIIKKCKFYQNPNNTLTTNLIYRINKVNEAFAEKGMRTIAFAYKPTLNEIEEEMIFLGLMGIMDSPKNSIRNVLENTQKAGIKMVMMTGDYVITAKSIARMIGMGENAITGEDFFNISEEQQIKLYKNYDIFARVTPEQKLRIVEYYQKEDQVVLMVGDGVNDAPALKKADIGIAMGREGTEVSCDAADVVLTDDDFNTVVKSITTGRSIYLNITNAIVFLLSGNIAGIIAVLASVILDLPMPFSPEHLLFINLLTDSVPAIAIGMMREDSELINRPPRKKHSNIVNRLLWKRVIMEGILISVATMLAFIIGLKYNINTGMTLAFSTLCLARLYHAFNATTKGSILRYGIENNYVIGAFLIGLTLICLVLFYQPLMDLFDVSKMNFDMIIWLNVLAISPLLIIQGYKFVKEMVKKC